MFSFGEKENQVCMIDAYINEQQNVWKDLLKLLTGITCEEGGKCGENFYSIYFWVFLHFS